MALTYNGDIKIIKRLVTAVNSAASAISTHTANTSNPHSVTASQMQYDTTMTVLEKLQDLEERVAALEEEPSAE